MRVTVHFADGEELTGDAEAISLEKLGFSMSVTGGNTRTVWVAMPQIKYVVVHNLGTEPTGTADPRANHGLQKAVFHFADGETIHSYRDEYFVEEAQGFNLRLWNPKEQALERVVVSGHGLKGVFFVESFDSRTDADKRANATRRRVGPVAEVPTDWLDDPTAEFDPELRRIAYSYQRRLALERDLELSSSDPLAFEQAISARLDRLLEDDLVAMRPEQKSALITFILRESVGFGPIDPLLKDPDITEIMVNAPDEVYIERAGQILRTQVRFEDNSQLMNVIRRMAATIGRRVDESTPMVDARLPDGSRLNAVIPPAATRGPALTIRKFRSFTMGLDELIREGTLSPAMAGFLQSAVQGRLNILISGGTGSGKTTTMNVLGSLIPARERVVTIEDSAELQLGHPHVVSLEYRPPNVEGKGELTIRSLLRNSLRMRPDRVMVGEVRDAAALDMLQAMNTGHDGSMSTIHSNSARDAFSRLETMVMTGSVDIPLSAVRAQVASALNLVVQQARLPDGTRKIIQIAEVSGYQDDTPVLTDIFRYTRTADGASAFIPTGEVPKSITKINFYGVDVPREIFSSDPYEVTTDTGAAAVHDAAAEDEAVAELVPPAPAASPEVEEAAHLEDTRLAPPPQEEPAALVVAEDGSAELNEVTALSGESTAAPQAEAAEASDAEPEADAPKPDAPVVAPTPLSSVSVGALHRRQQQKANR
jgi:pilus assembly protein CpaF